jgi:hypothetical protein
MKIHGKEGEEEVIEEYNKELDFRGVGYKLTEAMIREESKDLMESKGLYYMVPISVMISSISAVYFGQFHHIDQEESTERFREVISFILSIASLHCDIMLKRDFVSLIAYGFWISPVSLLMDPHWSEELSFITRHNVASLVDVGRDIRKACLYICRNEDLSKVLQFIIKNIAPPSWEYLLNLFLDPHTFHPSLSQTIDPTALVRLHQRVSLPDLDEIEFNIDFPIDLDYDEILII